MSAMITPAIAQSIDESVLCWLATISEDGFPNVSPKEAFLHDGESRTLVANIASPITVQNIQRDNRVCVSFVNVFIQRGYKISGRARVLERGVPDFDVQHAKLVKVIGSTFRVNSVTEITPTATAEIIAPSYHMFPESGPLDRIKESLQTYQVEQYRKRVTQATPTT